MRILLIFLINTALVNTIPLGHCPVWQTPVDSFLTNAIDCGDINGDGLPDIVVSGL